MYPKKVLTEQVKAMHKRQITHVGFFWYQDAEKYAQFLLIYEDRDTMHDTYALWHKQAKRAVKQYQRRGFVTHKVYATPEELMEWCQVNGKSRSSFANEKLKAATTRAKSLTGSIGLAGQH